MAQHVAATVQVQEPHDKLLGLGGGQDLRPLDAKRARLDVDTSGWCSVLVQCTWPSFVLGPLMFGAE